MQDVATRHGDAIDTGWVLLSAILVFFMQIGYRAMPMVSMRPMDSRSAHV
jgi:hypothetical protein